MSKTLSFDPVTEEQIRLYCEASGDWNRIHHDPEFARASGLPGIIAHGMLSMGLVAQALEEWGYPIDQLQNFSSKFKDIVVPGDRLKAILTSETFSEGRRLQIQLLKNEETEVLTAEAVFP